MQLVTAETILNGARAYARANGFKPLAIVVLDARVAPCVR